MEGRSHAGEAACTAATACAGAPYSNQAADDLINLLQERGLVSKTNLYICCTVHLVGIVSAKCQMQFGSLVIVD